MLKIDWKYEAIAELKNYRAIKNSIVSIRERIEMLEAAIEGIRSPNSDSVTGGSGTSRDTAYVDNIAKRDALKAKLTENTRIINLIDAGLSILSEQERAVITAAYIDHEERYIDKLSERLNLEKTAIYELRASAIEKYKTALYG